MPHLIFVVNSLVLSVNLIPLPISLTSMTCLFMLQPQLRTLSAHDGKSGVNSPLLPSVTILYSILSVLSLCQLNSHRDNADNITNTELKLNSDAITKSCNLARVVQWLS